MQNKELWVYQATRCASVQVKGSRVPAWGYSLFMSLIVLIMLNGVVCADNLTVTLNCPKSVSSGGSLTIGATLTNNTSAAITLDKSAIAINYVNGGILGPYVVAFNKTIPAYQTVNVTNYITYQMWTAVPAGTVVTNMAVFCSGGFGPSCNAPGICSIEITQ
ncbi:MAG: hypothetical protein HQK96_14625 [Nitrospirae bacterium]|nr:hypothetical protein [Nitrospirota bacterium]